jgi:histidinol-phosphate aminotransferase
MGLLDYYRQFEAMSEEEVNARLRERAAERRRKALAVVEPLDLSSTTWPHLPHPYVVNAVTYVARRGLHRYPGHTGEGLREELAHAHGLARERIVVGNGAAQLLGAAIQRLIEPGDELVCPWPGYPLLALLARRARGAAVPVAGFSAAALLEAVNPRTRVVALANPNDASGEYMEPDELAGLLDALPERVVVLLDEALVEFAGPEAAGASLELLDAHPRLLLFRSFSKAWGLAGLRCGYAIGGEGAEPMLDQLEPELGINDLTRAGALEALRSCSEMTLQRAAAVADQRERLISEVRRMGVQASDSRANFLWLERSGTSGAQFADALHRAGIVVAQGGPLGDPRRVRVSVQDEPASARLLSALPNAL